MQWPADRVAPRLAAISAALALAGCATFSPDGGFGEVERIAKDRGGNELRWVRTDADRQASEKRVAEILARPLSTEDAVQVALLNNRGLQARFHDLGISESDLVQAGRLPNPHFSMMRARLGDEYKIEQALTLNVLALVTMPLALEVEKRRLARTQREVAMDVLKLAGETRVAYYSAVAAEEGARYMRKVMEAAEASAELARRMARIGNWSKLNQAREHSFYADATLQLAKAENNATVSREQLTRLMGLWGSQIAFQLPERLPELPKEATDLPSVESAALDMRLDLNAAKLETEALARNLGLAKATRFINVLEFGPARVLEGQKSDPYKKGYEVSLELPIFDWGSSKVAKAEAIYMQAVERTAEMAVNARSEVREAYKGYRVSYDIARHYRDEIVPLRKRIADENLLRYNGMLIGIFELLADARSQIASVNSSVEATRDFWIASSNLAMALIGKPSLSGGMAISSPRAADAGNH